MTKHAPLSDVEVAFMDTLKLVFEIIVAKGISTPEILSEALQQQASNYPSGQMPRAIWVVEQLRAVLDDPARKELRALSSRPPEGRG